MYNQIPYIRLTTTQKEHAYAILRKGNLLLKKWAEFAPKFRGFRNAILEGDKNPGDVIPKGKLKEFHQDLPVITAIRHEVRPELGNRSVEQSVLENFSALAGMFARRWFMSGGNQMGITHKDYLQEAYMTVIEAIWQYNRDDIEFSTFVWFSLKNRMVNVMNQQGHLLCPLTNADLDLVSRYEDARSKANDHFTFDAIVKTLGLSDTEGRHLSVLLSKVFAEHQLGSEDQKSLGDVRPDYTAYRVGIDHEIDEVEKISQEQNVTNILDHANLLPMEREVIDAAMNPYYGWQTEFAKTHINPDTQKPYSRMRITQILQEARAKVAAVIEEKSPELVSVS